LLDLYELNWIVYICQKFCGKCCKKSKLDIIKEKGEKIYKTFNEITSAIYDMRTKGDESCYKILDEINKSANKLMSAIKIQDNSKESKKDEKSPLGS
jgi:hypothetical protein